jgi:hypothetical protein
VTLAIARAVPPLPEILEEYGLVAKIGKDHFYATDRDAVLAFGKATGAAIDLAHVARLEPAAAPSGAPAAT